VQVQTPRGGVQVDPNRGAYVQEPQYQVTWHNDRGERLPAPRQEPPPYPGWTPPPIPVRPPEDPGDGWSVEYNAPHAKLKADGDGLTGFVGDVEINIVVPKDVEPPKPKKPRPKK
jgi:hypothetical protein